MRITPLEIRQHTFDKSFRGYDTESVDAFLLSLSQEWERVAEEVRVTKQLLDKAEQEVARVKEIESSLFKTIKVAEEAQKEINEKAHLEAAKIIEDAKVEAERVISEANLKADQIEEDAKRQSNIVVSDAESRAVFLVEEADSKLKSFERDTKSLEKYKDLLVLELKKFATDTLDKISKFEERTTLSPEVVATSSPTPSLQSETEDIIHEPTADDFSTTDSLEDESDTLASNTEVESYDEEEAELPTVSSVLKEDSLAVEPLSEERIPSLASILENEADVSDNPLLDSLVQSSEPIAPEIVNIPEVVVAEEKVEVTSEMVNSAEDIVEENGKLIETNKALKKLKKLGDTKGLPTVSSVMEELKKDNPGSISNGGGSFFDSF
ncbi:MAG: DivIVA domain-containing protein [Flectobacillus sp.]|uniref:DivIVA domain-containing protein n=1 Tax=Flectobacillus sp. TaxID=50419 RepID=UPI003B99B7C0